MPKTSKQSMERDIARVRSAPQTSDPSPVRAAPSAEQRAYDSRSLREAMARQESIQRAPLDERQTARENFLEAMRDYPGMVAERIGWMLDGHYGHGEMLLARQILDRPRMNRAAALTHLIGVFEWGCPENFARDAWKRLSLEQQHRLDWLVQGAIRVAEETIRDA